MQQKQSLSFPFIFCLIITSYNILIITCKPSKKVKIPLTTKSSNYLLIPFPIDETDSPRMLYQDLDSKNKILFYYNEPDIIKDTSMETTQMNCIDHLEMFKTYILNTLGNSLDVEHEVEEVTK